MRTSPITWRGPAGSFARLAGWLATTVLILAAVLWPQVASAQVVSPRCSAPFTLTVAHSGSGTVNANACHEGFGIGFLTQAPTHGTVTIDTLASTVTYAHNGNGATSDTFRFDDGSGFYVQVNVTIGPASTITIAPASLSTITAGTPFSQTLTASGGTGPYTYAVTAGTLPTGLSLSPGGVLSGTPTQRGSFAFTVTATDSTAMSGAKSYNPTVAGGALSLTPNPPPNAVVTVPYSTTFTPAGGVSPMTLMWEPNASFPLPPGLSLSGNTLSGTPTATGTYTFGIRITDASTGPGSWFQVVNVTMTVSPPPTIVVNPVTVAGATVGAAYSQALSGSGGSAPYSFLVSAGALPAGLTLAANGALSGTPTAAGTFNFTVQATDNNGFSGTRAYTMVSAAPTLSMSPPAGALPSGTAGLPYAQSWSATGGTSAYGFTVTSGALPPGVSLAANGSMSGTPTASGTFNFSVTATDSSTGAGAPFTTTQSYSLTIAVAPITLSPTTIPGATIGAAYSQSITASGGLGTYTFSALGALPPGMTLAADGAFSGTPTAAGTFSFTVVASDGVSTGEQDYTLTVDPPTITVAPASLAGAQLGTAYSQTITASGGTAGYTFGVTAGTLPAGLALSTGGVLSGTPTATGTFMFTVTAVDSSTGTGPFTGSRAYTLAVADIVPIGNAVSATVAYNSVANPITLNITGGVPASVAIASAPANGTAVASGTSISYTPAPGFAGADSFTYTATNGAGTSAPATVSITISSPAVSVSPAGPLGATIANAFSQTFTFSGGTAPYSASVAGLPAGVSVTASTTDSITVAGTPTQAGSFTLVVSGTDSSGGSGPFSVTRNVGLNVLPPVLTLSPAAGTLTGTVGASYDQTFAANGGTAPFAYTVSAGALPPGLALSVAGQLAGTPTTPGLYTFSIAATDNSTGTGAPFSITQNYVFQVAAGLQLVTASLPDATASEAYNQAFAASGGTAPYTFSLTSGSLPTGLALAAGGALSGIPMSSGSFTFVITVTDAASGSASRSFTLQVDPAAAIVISPSTVPSGTAGLAYAQTLTASGGAEPYQFTVVAGALPAGITLSAAGELSGTASIPGTYGFTVRARDAGALTGEQAYSLQIGAPTIVIAPATLPAGGVGVAYSQTLTASGSTGPYAFGLASGSLPPGMSLSGAGVLAGTPTTAGTYTFDVTATDAMGFSGSTSYTVAIAEAVPVAVDDSATTDAATSVAIAVTSNDAGVIDSVAVVADPAHGSAVASGLQITYTPAAGFFGSDTFTYTATGPGGTSNVATVSIDVRALPVPVGVAQTLTTLAGQAIAFDAATGATGSPFTGVTLLTVPAEGTVVASGTTITYTPAPDATGAQAITYTLDNAFGASAPITTTVNVNPLPIAAALEATTLVGVAVKVELTEGATGGPFTAADVVGVSPAAAGTTQVTQAGTEQAPQFALTFTPAVGFVGTAVVTYTLDNAFATSAPAQVTIAVTQRPDPTRDAEVTGLLGAQNEAARRFARGQIDNFQSRMERLHDGGGQGFANGLTVAITSRCHDGRARRPGEACADEPLALPGATAADAGPDAPAAGRANSPFGVWTAGGMSFGDYEPGRSGDGFEFETSAVSAGLDYRFSPGRVLGAGLGYGRDVSDVGENGTRSEASARSLALYGSHQMTRDWFIDVLLGYQDLTFDARRYVTATGGMVEGSRDGDQWFGSLVSTYERRELAYTLAPYVRVDVARATLDAFTEHGDPIYALHYAEQEVESTTGNLGVRMEFHQALSWGMFSPMFRAEYQYDFEDAGVATLSYADLLGGPFYRTRLQGMDTRRLMLGIGAVLQTEHDWLLKAEFRGLLGSSQDEHSILLNIEKEF